MLTAYSQCFFCKYNEWATLNTTLTLMDSRHRSFLFLEERDPTW